MKQKIHYLINLHAGTGKIKEQLYALIDYFSSCNYELCVHTTQSSEDVSRYIESHKDNIDTLAVSGGDGTLSEAIRSMMENRIKPNILYIPCGSTNDYAYTLKMHGEPLEMAKNIEHTSPRMIDVGQFNHTYFTYVAAFGMFTNIPYETPQKYKNKIGYAAYILTGSKQVLRPTVNELIIETKDKKFQGRFLLGMITNSISVGGFKGLTGKNVKLNDGLFEVTLIKAPKNIFGMHNIIYNFVNKKAKSKYLIRFKTDTIKIHAKQPIAWTLDGENGGIHKEIEIKNIKSAISIYCPR